MTLLLAGHQGRVANMSGSRWRIAGADYADVARGNRGMAAMMKMMQARKGTAAVRAAVS